MMMIDINRKTKKTELLIHLILISSSLCLNVVTVLMNGLFIRKKERKKFGTLQYLYEQSYKVC